MDGDRTMCSVLIFTKPENDHDDLAQDWKKHKCGDVIDISNIDKFEWGKSITGPDSLGWWTVITVPGAHKSALEGLLSSDPMPYGSIDPADRLVIPHRIRTHTVDVQRLKPEMTVDQLLSIACVKPEVPVNALFGAAINEIG